MRSASSPPSPAAETVPSEHPQFPGKLWIRGPLRISIALLSEVEAHAKETYPSECCGFLFGPAQDAALLDRAQREPNEADKYHKLDPVAFPRTSSTYFKINELRASRTLDSASAEGRPLKVIYHSHCDAGAYFSEEDAATFAQDKTLMWPCAFLVVSVKKGSVEDRKLWVHTPGTNTFEESPLEIV